MHRFMQLTTRTVLIALTLSGCAFISIDLGSLTRIPPMEERVLKTGSADKVLVLEVAGPITTTAIREARVQAGQSGTHRYGVEQGYKGHRHQRGDPED